MYHHKALSHAGVVLATLMALGLGTAPQPAHAWLGALAKLGSAAGKSAGSAAGAAGKGAAAGGAAVAGAEVAGGLNAAGKVGKAGAGAADEAGAAAATSADDISRSSGLGAAVPDEVRALMTPGKTLADVPDTGARNWLALPKTKLKPQDAAPMVSDYVALLEGKAAKGPQPGGVTAKAVANKTSTPPHLPSTKPAAQVPWYAIELLVRAAHVGHRGAQTELSRVCNEQAIGISKGGATTKPPHSACSLPTARPLVATK